MASTERVRTIERRRQLPPRGRDFAHGVRATDTHLPDGLAAARASRKLCAEAIHRHAKLLGLLKHFVNRTGKYAVQGYPHKFGLLLHGPPGTGKTSLIKALAQHTGRSIVNVPLARITTNQELMDIMFDQSYMVMGDEVCRSVSTSA